MWIKGNPLALLVGMQAAAATLENSMTVPQNVKYRTSLWSSNHTTGCLPEEYENNNSKGYMSPYISCNIIYNITIWKQSKYFLIIWLMRWYMYTHTHTHTHSGKLLSHKKNEILPFADTWMELESTVLSETHQLEQDKCLSMSLLHGI